MPAFLTITSEHPDKDIEGSEPMLLAYFDDKPFVIPQEEAETTTVLVSLDFSTLRNEEGLLQLEGLTKLVRLHESQEFWEILETAFKEVFKAGRATRE